MCFHDSCSMTQLRLYSMIVFQEEHKENNLLTFIPSCMRTCTNPCMLSLPSLSFSLSLSPTNTHTQTQATATCNQTNRQEFDICLFVDIARFFAGSTAVKPSFNLALHQEYNRSGLVVVPDFSKDSLCEMLIHSQRHPPGLLPRVSPDAEHCVKLGRVKSQLHNVAGYPTYPLHARMRYVP